MDRSTSEIRLAHWTKIAEECSHRPNGMIVTVWAKDHGIFNGSIRVPRRARSHEIQLIPNLRLCWRWTMKVRSHALIILLLGSDSILLLIRKNKFGLLGRGEEWWKNHRSSYMYIVSIGSLIRSFHSKFSDMW